jgi:dihydroorotate dehydrogenase (NAD+) catalytic subunit
LIGASGCCGHYGELASFGDLSGLGAVVVKSVSLRPMPGNPPPRLFSWGCGMLNSVGLQNPGIASWLEEFERRCKRMPPRFVVSVFARSVEEFREIGEHLAFLPSNVIAVEVNLSCPNLSTERPFGASPEAAAAAVEQVARTGLPVWAKLTPASDLVAVAGAVTDAGAAAVVASNTYPGLVTEEALRGGAREAGLSGPPLFPLTMRAVADLKRSLPDLPVIACGGIDSAYKVLLALRAGACAVQVGTALIRNPRCLFELRTDLAMVLAREGYDSLSRFLEEENASL